MPLFDSKALPTETREVFAYLPICTEQGWVWLRKVRRISQAYAHIGGFFEDVKYEKLGS